MTTPFEKKLQESVEAGRVSDVVANNITVFYKTYHQAIQDSTLTKDGAEEIFLAYLDFVIEQCIQPHTFTPYHPKVKTPDYRAFAMNLLEPLVLMDESTFSGQSNLDQIADHMKKGENVILFGNHQIEPDPQMIELLFQTIHPELADQMIFVAGHRVTTDPMAIPFSLGCNLLCIYSKKYMELAENKEKMLRHNQQTMKQTTELLKKGGVCIYVAPSGGRDRANQNGVVKISDFNPQSIEMFRLVAKKSGTPTHFYPLALATHNLLPPPQTIEQAIGEDRNAARSPIHIAIGDEINFDSCPGNDLKDKKEKRAHLARYIQKLVEDLYSDF